VKLLSNVTVYGGDVALVTITAPGADRLPDRRAMVDWNLAAPPRWRRLHSAARSAAIREGLPVTIVARTWEYQKRGALHVHVIVGVATALELAGAHAYANHLARLRGLHDFGFVDRGRRTGSRRALEVVPAERAARYMAKYLAPIRGGKLTLSETAQRRDVPPHVLHISRVLTAKTGVTMRSIRWRRRCFMARVDPATGETWASMATRSPTCDSTRRRLASLQGSPQGF
jgi:hypothetical protein